MRKIMLSALACAAVVLMAASVEAQGRRGINGRQRHQQQRIGGGVRSGELTGRETLRLEHEQYRIQRLETRLKNSGDDFTARERARVNRELNQSSRHIYRAKHNEADRGDGDRLNINERQENQQDRIGGGVRSGELTNREILRLEREQYQIQQMEERLRNSGDDFTRRERARVQGELNQSSRHIYRAKHNRRDRN